MSNSARIVKKIIIQENIVTLSPLRIATGQNDGKIDTLVLKNKQGQAYIPGTSLAGVLRSELSDIYSEELMDKFFGSTAHNGCNQSMLNISDIILKESQIIGRDGVAIDALTCVGKDGAKYDYEAVERGCEGRLKIEVTVREFNRLQNDDERYFAHDGFDDIYFDICATIADLLNNGFNVGSLTTKGFGQIKSKKAADVYVFDFAEAKAADNWLEYLQSGSLKAASVYTAMKNKFAKAADDLYLQVACQLHSSMLIKSDEMEEEDIKKKVSAVQMKSKDDYVIPGTTIKGVLKNRGLNILLILSNNNELAAQRFLDRLMGFSNKNNSYKSRFSVNEVYISPEDMNAKIHGRNRIDRFTGSTIESALFFEKPVWQKHKEMPVVSLSLRIKKCSVEEAGLIMLLLKDLWAGNIFIGSGKSVGRGILLGRYCEIDYHNEHFVIDETDKFSVKGNKDKLESYVQALVGEFNG